MSSAIDRNVHLDHQGGKKKTPSESPLIWREPTRTDSARRNAARQTGTIERRFLKSPPDVSRSESPPIVSPLRLPAARNSARKRCFSTKFEPSSAPARPKLETGWPIGYAVLHGLMRKARGDDPNRPLGGRRHPRPKRRPTPPDRKALP
jgi:hypothetical protein